MNSQNELFTARLPGELAADVEAAMSDWRTNDKVQRLWDADASLWTGADESRWLGWLRIAESQLGLVGELEAIGRRARDEGFTHAIVLGMGGSSMCPEVLRMTWGRIASFPDLHVLDSTDPAQVRRVHQRLDLDRTLFIVSSKSGNTLEPNIFAQYFFDRVRARVGDKAGRQFIAVTDPGSHLEEVARRDGFAQILAGVPSIGGRYSALSHFGLVPAAVMGLDVRRLLERAQEMVQACGSAVPVSDNPGLRLGLVLGLAALRRRDKVTIVTSPGIWDLGAWLEQLLAESTGKHGRGLIPSDGERVGPPEVYGRDRVFVYLRLEDEPDAAQGLAMDRLEAAGHPVVRIGLRDQYDLGREFFRWEFATAVAGSILEINPFDQPDVEASKVATRSLTDEYERRGALPVEEPLTTDAPLTLFADPRNADVLREAVDGDLTVEAAIRAHVRRLADGDYFGLLAYVDMTERHRELLQEIRHAVRDAARVVTCLGFGPRFLHSTGQAYKGGPNSGVFLQITCDDADDVQVPGQQYSFGIVKAAQARGDLEVLAERGRRALRVHLGPDVQAGLARLLRIITDGLASER